MAVVTDTYRFSGRRERHHVVGAGVAEDTATVTTVVLYKGRKNVRFEIRVTYS